MSWSVSALGLVSPRYTLISVGKNVMIATTPILDAGLMLPSQMPSSGESATIGTALDPTEKGTNPSASSGKRTHTVATSTPNVQPIAKPASASPKVNSPI